LLIATTLKNAKGESVFTKLNPLRHSPRGFLFWDRVAGEEHCMTAPFPSEAALFGREGELISLSIAIEPKLLEDLLEALAGLDFPVNPQLYHRPAQVLVEFPAYSTQVEQVRAALLGQGFDAGSIQIAKALLCAK
jgi:hypothetical protein